MAILAVHDLPDGGWFNRQARYNPRAGHEPVPLRREVSLMVLLCRGKRKEGKKTNPMLN